MRSLYNILLLIILIVILSDKIKAQQNNPATIKGSVIEKSSHNPQEFVNVGLFRAADSMLVQGTNTDIKGKFTLSKIIKGNYYLRFSFIGFETVYSDPVSVKSDDQQIDLGVTSIKVSSSLLGGVEISDKKSLYETSIDRKVYNVDKDMMSITGSASDVLQNVPSVNLDMDGNISLRGSTNVTIFINGKPSPMMKMNSADALQQIPASNIERVEIITNPSAKYKPDGTTGIINIVMKKGSKTGLNGTVRANLGNDWRYNGGFNLNYKPGKVNMFAGYSFRQDERVRTHNTHRLLNDSAGSFSSTYDQISVAHSRPMSHTANLGMDYNINNGNSLGISGNLVYRDFDRSEYASTLQYDAAENLTNDFNRNRVSKQNEYETEITAYYEHKFKKENHQIRYEATYSGQVEDENNQFTDIFRLPSMADAYDNSKIDENSRLVQCSVEYTYPINDASEFETGYAGEFSRLDQNYYSEDYNAVSDSWTKNIAQSNHFLLNQNIHAIYATYSHKWGSFSILGGLRAEQVYLISNLLTLDSLIPNNYFKLYPTIHMAYDLSETSQLQLNYSKRINRPETDDLNPFPEYNDPRNLHAGNPHLKPEQIHSIEFGYQLKNEHITFVPTLFYRYKYDAFTEITKFINDSTLLHTNDNLANEQSAGVEIVLNSSIKKFMTINFSANGFFDQIDASNLGYSAKKTAFSWNAKLGLNFNLTKTTLLQLNGFYRAAEITPQGNELPVYSLNAGMRQDLFKKKFSVLLTVSDIFNTLRWSGEINTPQMYEKMTGKRRSQIVYLGVSWRFGKSGKNKQEEMKFDSGM